MLRGMVFDHMNFDIALQKQFVEGIALSGIKG